MYTGSSLCKLIGKSIALSMQKSSYIVKLCKVSPITLLLMLFCRSIELRNFIQ
jgi:hypothetical protein